jgi:hypothetical protein
VSYFAEILRYGGSPSGAFWDGLLGSAPEVKGVYAEFGEIIYIFI